LKIPLGFGKNRSIKCGILKAGFLKQSRGGGEMIEDFEIT